MTKQLKISRIGLVIAVREYDETSNEWNTISTITVIEKINSRTARDLTDAELLENYTSGGSAWTINLPPNS
jgi:hypothetical protein